MKTENHTGKNACATLDEWKHRYGSHDIGGLERLLDEIAAKRFTDPAELIRLHETLLFLRAYPQSRGIAHRTGAMLADFGKRVEGLDAEAFQAPEVSGIAATSLTAVFSHGVARRLAERHPALRIDWEAYDTPDRMGSILRRIVPFAAEDWPVEAHPPFRRWFEAAAGPKDLAWLLPKLDADSYDSMQLPLYWELRDAPHTRSSVYDEGAPYYHHTPLLRRQGISLHEAFTAAPLPVKRLPRREAGQQLEMILDTSAVRYRELYGFTHPDARFMYRIEAGRGLAIYWFGVPPEWRLPLRAYHAGMFLKNGVPAGYVEVLSLFDRAEIGFNLYYTFREGESAWIYARLLQLIHQMLGVNTLLVDPYQLGHENQEALDSGAFWFYRKLGFSPVDATVARLVEREERRIAESPGYRSNRATLENSRPATCDSKARKRSLAGGTVSTGERSGSRRAQTSRGTRCWR